MRVIFDAVGLLVEHNEGGKYVAGGRLAMSHKRQSWQIN